LFIPALAIMPLHDLVNAISSTSTPSGAGTAGVQHSPSVEVTTKENLVDTKATTTTTTSKDIGGAAVNKDSDSRPLTTTPATILDDHSSTGSLRSEDDDEKEEDDLLVVAAVTEAAVGTAAIRKTEHKLAEEAGLHLTEPLLVENPHRFVLFPIQDNEVRLFTVYCTSMSSG
jgi:hypothetical protein